MHTDAIAWTERGSVRLLDQTLLPHEITFLDLDTVDGMVEAIQLLRVRGAPLIGVAAAMGLAAAAERRATEEPSAAADTVLTWLDNAARRMASARPTAVNLQWAVDRVVEECRSQVKVGLDAPARVLAGALRKAAQQLWDEDAAMCRAIGDAGAGLFDPGVRLMTHCNAGMLATGGIGTAIGVIHAAHEQGKVTRVYACEARPLRQGARLTAWELARLGVPCTVVVDSAAATVMAQGRIDAIVLGADRIAANGDTANKIGTHNLALLARAHDIPFYVAAPRSTFDADTPTGAEIPIEERAADEVDTADGVSVYNPAFDVTPAECVTAFVTDGGVLRPPFPEAIGRLLGSRAAASAGAKT